MLADKFDNISQSSFPLWINGVTRSGKTTYLVNAFRRWVLRKRSSYQLISKTKNPSDQLVASVLVLAANEDNRRFLSDAVSLSYPMLCKTPLGFITDEVMLFWPLLFEQLNLKAQFPLRLRPETEQELATRLWRSYYPNPIIGISEARLVRTVLDLLQLAGASGIALEDIPTLLDDGLSSDDRVLLKAIDPEQGIQKAKEFLDIWRQWCIDRGLLSYGIIYDLYWRCLLPDPKYQNQLKRRISAVFADDLDDYPAIAKDLFDFFLTQQVDCVFTFNSNGKIRLGLNADPDHLASIAAGCRIKTLLEPQGLASEFEETLIQSINDPIYLKSLPDQIESIQTISRADNLRKISEVIIQAVKQQYINPADIVIIAPGLDEIARYSFIEALTKENIPVQPLNEQRPLNSSPLVRTLLTLLALIYPGLGRLVTQDAVAEMLVILSRSDIDPVRAGLIADSCYHVDPEYPSLLPLETFQRWDRLGYRASTSYSKILEWINHIKELRQQQGLTPIMILDRAIKQLINYKQLMFDQLAVLRELMETAQHYWEVDRRLRQNEPSFQTPTDTIAQFIQLLRRGTITANPYPVRNLSHQGAVTLSNIFQYRSLRTAHRWQFWLDTGSPLWPKGGAATLYGAPLFLRNWSGQVWTPEDQEIADQERLQRIIKDLLGRATEKIILCHSDLSVSGTEQIGPLLSLVQASREIKDLAPVEAV
ncbi:recombinase family protein [Chroococcus sp. FPU101]|uniref:recombinase family protein n=1 Tax=Chroococcus sp. FPU101 TaxID=1974212 RepID=UPI001A8D1E89|nr:recombinase family protein [Chroococcus sp. FPU101]